VKRAVKRRAKKLVMRRASKRASLQVSSVVTLTLAIRQAPHLMEVTKEEILPPEYLLLEQRVAAQRSLILETSLSITLIRV
jgi:hypothetical protein